jgi:hypothetical protein
MTRVTTASLAYVATQVRLLWNIISLTLNTLSASLRPVVIISVL